MYKKKNYYSFSSISEYDNCPFKYKTNRIDKLKYKKLKSPLFFGSAIDAAMEIIFLSKKKELSDDDNSKLESSYVDVFVENLTFGKNYKWEKVKIVNNINIKYSAQDYQNELLDVDDIIAIKEIAKTQGLDLSFDDHHKNNLTIVDEFKEECFDDYKKSRLDDDLLIIYNHIHWLCLIQKGKLILSDVEIWVEENVKETVSIQKEFRIESGEDLFIAKLDLVIIDNNGTKVLVDFKTTSMPYREGDAEESPQLAIYSEFEEMEEVAFLAYEKKVRKRDPRIRHQYIRGVITEDKKVEVFNNIETSIKCIENKVFDKNFNSCYTYGKCEYYDYCRNGSLKNLEYTKKGKK